MKNHEKLYKNGIISVLYIFHIRQQY